MNRTLNVVAIFCGTVAMLMAVYLWPRPQPQKQASTEFQNGAVAKAMEAKSSYESTQKEGRELGLTCITMPDECSALIARAKKNTKLAEAFQYAKSRDVGIIPSGIFKIDSAGYVTIDDNSTDEQIIKFLLGK